MTFESHLEGRERAQLILVGAVAIAFIVMGLVVVFNTVLYTENVASTGAVNEPREAAELKAGTELGTKKLVGRVSTNGNWTSQSALNSSIASNVSAYSDGMRNVTAASSPTFVSFRRVDVTKWGVNVQHHDGSEFDNGSTLVGGDGNWTVAKPNARTGGFTMTVKRASLDPVRSAGGRPFGIVWAANDGTGNYTVWLYQNSSGNVVVQTLQNTSSPEDAYDETEGCALPDSDSEANVTIDFDEGVIEGYPECSKELDVDSAVAYSEKRSIRFRNGNNASGQYSLVVNDESYVGDDVKNATGGPLSFPLTADETPYYTWATWSIELEMTIQSPSMSFTDTFVIEVYNRSR